MRQHRLPWRATRRPIVVLMVAVLVAAVASACAGHTRASGDPTTRIGSATSQTVPPTAAAPDDPTHAVLAAYQEFWRVWLEANNPPNPNDPNLPKVATGSELLTMKRSIAKKLANGTFTRQPPHSRYRHTARLLSLQVSRASVLDCALDDLQVVRAKDGAIVNNQVATEQIHGYLTRTNSGWRVSNISITSVEVGACA